MNRVELKFAINLGMARFMYRHEDEMGEDGVWEEWPIALGHRLHDVLVDLIADAIEESAP